MSGSVAILLAGGSGSRAHPTRNKLFLPVLGRDLLEYSFEMLAGSPAIDRVVVVARSEDTQRLHAVIGPAGAVVTTGGAARHRSEMNGLEAVAPEIESGDLDVVAIHDGARPFATRELLQRLVATARDVGGAVPGVEFDDPVFQVGRGAPTLVPRAALRRVQTPQVFRAGPLLEAYRRAAADGFEGVDTAETVERYSDIEVAVVPGDPRNIKVTFGDDLVLAEALAGSWAEGAWTNGT